VSDVVARKASLAVNRGAVRPLASRHGEIRGNGNGVFKRLEARRPCWTTMRMRMTDREEPQAGKFKEAARELECDDDEQRFKGRLEKLVKHEPAEEPETG
jgi:hypothetical protein